MPAVAGSGELAAVQPTLYLGLVLGFVALFTVVATRITGHTTDAAIAETSFGDHARTVVVWHTSFAVAALVAASLADLPYSALGLGPGTDALRVGLGVGLAAVGLTLLLDVGLDRLGVPDDPNREASERLRTPTSAPQWLLHVSAVVPVQVLGTELLLRGAVVGGLGVTLGLHPVSLVMLSALCHVVLVAPSGRRAMLVGAVAGALLAAAFLVTGSLLASALAFLVVQGYDTVDNVRQYGTGRDRAADWMD